MENVVFVFHGSTNLCALWPFTGKGSRRDQSDEEGSLLESVPRIPYEQFRSAKNLAVLMEALLGPTIVLSHKDRV